MLRAVWFGVVPRSRPPATPTLLFRLLRAVPTPILRDWGAACGLVYGGVPSFAERFPYGELVPTHPSGSDNQPCIGGGTARQLGHPFGGSMYQEMSVHELAEGLERRDVVLLDVRDADQFAGGHIPGSLAVSLPDLPGRLRTPDDELWERLFGARRSVPLRVGVVGDGERAIDAVAILGELGISCYVVTGGTRAWSAAGRPLNRRW